MHRKQTLGMNLQSVAVSNQALSSRSPEKTSLQEGNFNLKEQDILKTNLFEVRQNMNNSHYEIVDNVYSRFRDHLKQNLGLMDQKFKEHPQHYQMKVKRNLNSYAEEHKLEEQRKISNIYKEQVNIINQMAEDEGKLKDIQAKYGIMIKQNDKLPYPERIQRDCVDKKFFYYYKKNRIETLTDTIPDREEPFHKKYAKE